MISSTYKVLWGYKNLFNFEGLVRNRPFSPLCRSYAPLFGLIPPTSSELISELRSRRHTKLVTGTKYIVSTLPKKLSGIPGSEKTRLSEVRAWEIETHFCDDIVWRISLRRWHDFQFPMPLPKSRDGFCPRGLWDLPGERDVWVSKMHWLFPNSWFKCNNCVLPLAVYCKRP